MKLAKKALSVFLSLLMVFGTCSVCLTGFSFTAGAASSYTVAQIKELVDAAASKAATVGSASDAWTYSGDDGSVLAAAEAIYDYAVNGVRVTGTNSTTNSSNAIYEKVLADLGYATNSNQGIFIRNVLYPNGTTVYGYGSRQSTNGSWEDKTSMSNGTDLTNNSNVSYNTNVLDSVTKTATVNVDVSKYLLTFDTINDIPSSFATKVVYTFVNTNGKSASQTTQSTATRQEGSGCDAENVTYYTHNWTSYKWNYISSAPTRVVTSNTTVKADFEAFGNFFTDELLATTAEDLLELTPAELDTAYNNAMTTYNSFVAKGYNATVIEHFFGTKIQAYMSEVQFAKDVVTAEPNMATMLGYINGGYDTNNVTEMENLHATATDVLDIIKNIDSLNPEIVPFVIANYDGYENFSIEASQAFLDKLFLDIEIYYVSDIKEAIDAEIATYESLVADPYNRDDITDFELTELMGRLDGYVTAMIQYSGTAINAVFTDTTRYFYDFKGNVQTKIYAREIDVNYLPHYDYFYPIIFGTLPEDPEDLAWYAEDEAGNSYLTGKYDEDYAKLQELIATYNSHLGTYDKTIVDEVYSVMYNGEKMLLQKAVEDYLNRLLDHMEARVKSSLDAVKYYADLYPEVNFSNVVELGTALSDYSLDLYDYVNAKGRIDGTYPSIAATVNAVKEKYDAFIASGGLEDFEKVSYDQNGYYTIRYAGEQTDAAGNPIGYPNDIARDGADDNYVVTNKELEETVKKIDTLITSEELGAILGLEDEEGNQYETLGAYVDGMINGLFSDETINMIIAMLFPMVANLLETELVGMLSDLGGGATPSAGATAAIDLAALGISAINISGVLDVYLNDAQWNGSQQQRYFSEVFGEIGLNIYPGPLADSLANSGALSKDSELYKALKAANNSWLPLAIDPAAEEPEYEFTHEWGVTDYESFVTVFGNVLDAIAPLINPLFGNGSLSTGEVSTVGYAVSQGKANIKVGSGWLSLSISPELRASAGVELSVGPVNLYDKLWIPLMEALGVTEGDNAYALSQFPANANGKAAAKALFDPVLALVEQVKTAPIEKVLNILPGLVYALSMDKLQFILEDLQIDLGVNLVLRDIWLSVDNVPSWAESIIEGALDGLSIDDLVKDPFILGELLDLQDLLGFDYHNINEIIEFALADVELPIPEIKQSDLIFLADVDTMAESYRSSGSRIKFTADKADILYYLLQYVSTALGSTEFVDGLFAMIQGDGEALEIPPIVYDIIANAGMNPDGLLAAVIELFVPQSYSKAEMEWFESEYTYGGIEGANDASIVYLNYGNDWTKQKADYLVDNVDAILESVLEMTGSEETKINVILQDSLSGLFTNDTITSVISAIVSLGSSLDATMLTLLEDALETDLSMLYDAFGYLFPAEEDEEAEDDETIDDSADAEAGEAEEEIIILKPGDEGYVNNTPITAVTSEAVNEETGETETVITWYYNGAEFVDGDRDMFLELILAAIDNFIPLVSKFFKGETINILGAIDLLCYESYADTFGILLEVLGVQNVMDQAEYEAYAAANGDSAAVRYILDNVLTWFDGLLEGNTVKKVVDILPNLIYFIESNGLSTFLHNLLMPVLVVLDTVRPLLNVDLNGVLSFVVSELISYGELDTDKLLQFISGVAPSDLDPDYKWFAIDVNNLNITEIVKLVDTYFGTKLADSQLVNPGLAGLCAGREAYDSVLPEAYRSTMDTSDALTILLSAVLEGAEYEVADGKTNGDIICEFIDAGLVEDGEEPMAAEIYSLVMDLIKGLEISYTVPNWGYMFDSNLLPDADGNKIVLPEHSIVYLGYNTDWTEDTATAVYDSLDEIVDMILESALEEGETIATLLNGVLNDEVYSDEILTTIVETLVNAIAALDGTLRDLVDVIVDTDIAAWFAFCEETTDEEGNPVWVCTKDWGVDEAAEEDKKDIFVGAIKEVLAPANSLLSWLFFGTSYEFFTGTEKNEDGSYAYNSIITLNGGEGYAYGLVPILEALGLTMKPASAYVIDENTYDVPQAVEDIFNALLALVDNVSAAPVEEVFKLLPNLIYFINADGVKSSVNNLLAPVDAIIEKLAPIISEDGEAVSISGLLEETIGFDISDLSMDTLLGLAADAGFTLSGDMVQILKTFYIGELEQYTSANGEYAYRMVYNDEESAYDMLTIVLSFALDAFNLNSELFADLLGEETYYAVYNLIRGASEEFVYREMNWAYMYDGEDAASLLYNNGLPERTGDAYEIYTQYQNNWNTATADYLDSVLDQLVKDITDAIRNDGSSLGKLLDDAITNGLYQDDILNSLIEAAVGLMIDYEEIIKGTGVLLGAESISDWFDYCEITTDENGETVVTCTKDWGIDAATTNEAKRTAFVEGFVTALKPAYRLLAWLLFGEDYTFLNGTTNEVLITITGGEGYDNAFVPLLEGLMCTMNYEGTESGIKPASAFYDESGNLDMEQAVRDVFTALTDWLNMICGDLDGQGSIGIMLDILPSFIYFVNADGLKVVVNNLLVPVNNILDALKPMGVEVDLNELIGMDITNFDFYAIFDLVEDLLGLYFPDYTQDFLATFYIGEAVAYESANGKLAYRLAYTDAEPRRDMITCLISFVVDTFVDPRNDEVLIGWLGEDIYYSIVNVLNIKEAKPMQEFSWLFTEDANTDKVFTAIETSGRYTATYNEDWTKDKAQYLADNFEIFIGNILCMLKLEVEGNTTESLEDVLDAVIENNLYTQANADAIIEAIKGLVAELEGLEGFAGHIEKIADTLLGIDIRAWDDMTVTVVDGDRESFSDALGTILAPAVPLLELLLVGEDIKLFYSLNGGADAIVIHGSEGYAYGIVPLLEALGCDTVLTPEEYKAGIEADPANAITGIIDPLFDRIDAIAADPANEIIDMLPAVIYFINSNGLDTSVKNIVNSVDTVLAALEPVLGSSSLMDLLGIDLATYDFEYIFNMLLDMVAESTGFELTGIAADAVAELTTGKVVTYESKNGETYYTMQYASEKDKADMVTVLLRLIVDFVTMEENLQAIEDILADYISDEETHKSVCSLLESLAESVSEDPGMGKALSILYYIFFALSESAEGADDIYHDVTNSWDFILKMLETSEEPLLNNFANSLKDTLNKYFGTDYETPDEDDSSSGGSMSFFDRIAEFFRKIGEFFRKLFGID